MTIAPEINEQTAARRKPRRLFIGLLGITVIAFTWARLNRWEFRRALPWSANEVRERYQSEGLLPDYLYQLKARITAEEFHRYVARLRLTPHSETRRYSDELSWLSWEPSPADSGDWWNPSASLDGTFVRQEGDTWTFAKFESGHLYVKSLNH